MSKFLMSMPVWGSGVGRGCVEGVGEYASLGQRGRPRIHRRFWLVRQFGTKG